MSDGYLKIGWFKKLPKDSRMVFLRGVCGNRLVNGLDL
jgi:hypothetical protein